MTASDPTVPGAGGGRERAEPHDTLPPRGAAPAGWGAGEELGAGAVIKHYEVLRALGRGGMGTVYLARDARLARPVALKVLRGTGAPAVRRLLEEARATARCRHENIVVLYEADEVGGRPYLALEYLTGRTLRDWLAERTRPGGGGPAPASLAVELMLPVVRALACAHAAGLVHRDLKPANVMLTDEGVVKVLDFGIAVRPVAGERAPRAPAVAAVAGEQTQSGEVLGTLPYMAPEQWQGEPVDARADLWAAGVMLFQLVTGEHPLGAAPALFELSQVGALEVPMPSVYGRAPEVGPLGAVIDRCLRKAPAERFGSADALLAALESLGSGRPNAPASDAEESPFAGLGALQEADAGRFFGREADVAAALGRLRSHPMLATVGPSGSGKSSFLRAGVAPAWKRARGPTVVLALRPGRRPLAALAEVLLQGSGAAGGEAGADVPGGEAVARARAAGDSEGLVELLRAQPGLLGAHLRARCRRGGEGRRLALLVDQFEELYTLGADAAERRAFVACLAGVADDASSPLRVLLSLRADFLDRVAEEPAFAVELTRGLVLLPPLGRAGLRAALARPVEAAGYRFEDEALLGAMLDELAGARSPLPLLQFAADRLWQARDRERRLLTRQSYERLGGVAGALSTHADAVLATLSAAERELCRALLLRLVTPERTRAVVGLDELRALGPEAGAVERVLGRLAEARLVLIEGASGGEGPVVELVHESLLERWATLRGWLEQSAQDAQFLARLRAASRAWAAGGEAEGLLWSGRAADEARAWLEQRRSRGGAAAEPGAVEGRFLRAVVARAGRARRRWRQAVAGAMAALCLTALLVSLFALRARREAARAGQEALRANEEAARARLESARADREAALARNATRIAAARELLPADPTTALALLREVEPPGVPDEWPDLAFHALHGGVSAEVFAHPAKVRRLAFSPDGARLATASFDGVVRVWPLGGGGEPLEVRAHEGTALGVAFSPDGRRLASGGADGAVRVWPAAGEGEPLALRGHGGSVYAVAFSPDGARVVSASADRTVRVWPADGRGEPLVLRGHGAAVYAAAFSPDGARVVSASEDATVRVWPADGRGEPLVLRGHRAAVFNASFSPDGQRLLTTSEDKTARLWALPAGPPGRPGGRAAPVESVVFRHDAQALGAAFGPDGRRFATSSLDGTARVVSAEGAGELFALRGHTDEVMAIAFSPDGRLVATASADQTARVWPADGRSAPRVLRGHGAEVIDVSFSPDGERIASASLDATVRVWGERAPPVVLRGHGGQVHAASFSPDGRRVVSASADRTVRVWAADGRGAPLVLRGHEGTVYAAAFSPDGARVVSASEDATVRVWPADGRGEPLVLRGHGREAYAASFSPDGARVVSASRDKTVRVWPADGRGEPLALAGHDAMVYSARFSPDGARVVTGGNDGLVRVFSADGRGEPLVLRGHKNGIGTAAFSPDGRWLLSSSYDGSARVWPADGRGAPLTLRGHRGAVNAAAWAPDGRRVVTASVDATLHVWPDLTRARGPDDPRLWGASAHCPSAARRVELLHVAEEAARADFDACRRRVDAARRAPAPR